MIIDFSKINRGNSIDKILHPREIFMALPEKIKKYEYPRDVQTEVWNQWFEIRNNPNNIIKMNTGGGKTVVGLLILRSCLNEGKGPAVYVVPDPYLVYQVANEAKSLGLEITDNENDPSYLRGRSILLINIHKLINGKSVFGMRRSGNNIPIGSILIDDVHACLHTTESQFTTIIRRDDKKYNAIYTVFLEDLKIQNENRAYDIEIGVPSANMLVPYWAWHKKIAEVNKILNDGITDEDIEFSWPLIRNCLKLCNCVISSDKIEISPKSIPIHEISSFDNASRRIFMSATLSDDSILVSHFNVDTDKISKIITPEKADDIGDRLIIFPQVLNTDIDDDYIKYKMKELSLRYNVVIIVPSTYRSNYWRDVSDLVLNSSNLYEGVQKLKKGHVGLVVLINKYDGIDLPDEACRVLVIDGLPDLRSEYDKIEQGVLHGSGRIIDELVQRIEQGMGRGVRSNSDYCVVFLMGKNLTHVLYGDGSLNKFSLATKAQLELSEAVTDQVKGKSADEIFEIVDYSLSRNKEWVSTSKSILREIIYNRSKSINPVILASRNAFDYAEKRDYENSVKYLNDLINTVDDKFLRGWLKQQLAEYMDFINVIDSQNILKSALVDNVLVIKPIEGIQYEKKLKVHLSQGLQFVENTNKSGLNENRFTLKVNDLIEKLMFLPGSADTFEQAVCDLAKLLGFKSRRPENEIGRGPDVIWHVGELKFFVIECKNGVTNEIINKHDCNQLNGSINWFDMEYDHSCNCDPIMIHPSTMFDYTSSPNKSIRIMNKEGLELLKANFQKFSRAAVISGNFNNPGKINELLREHNLSSSMFIEKYTTKYSVKNKV